MGCSSLEGAVGRAARSSSRDARVRALRLGGFDKVRTRTAPVSSTRTGISPR